MWNEGSLLSSATLARLLSSFSPPFTRLEASEWTGEAEAGRGVMEMSGRDRSGMREKMTLLNLNEKSLAEAVPLLDLPWSVNSRHLLRGLLMCQQAGAVASCRGADLAECSRGACQSDRLSTASSILSQSFDRLITTLVVGDSLRKCWTCENMLINRFK